MNIVLSLPRMTLVPTGPGARPEAVHADLSQFLKIQIPGARYVLSVCTGSWILAGTGFLDGKKATTNKSVFKTCKAGSLFLQFHR